MLKFEGDREPEIDHIVKKGGFRKQKADRFDTNHKRE